MSEKKIIICKATEDSIDYSKMKEPTAEEQERADAEYDAYLQGVSRGIKIATRDTIRRLWCVLIRDGEQFVAGELRKIAKEEGFEVDE